MNEYEQIFLYLNMNEMLQWKHYSMNEIEQHLKRRGFLCKTFYVKMNEYLAMP